MSGPSFKERLGGAGDPVIATFVIVPRVEIIQLIAQAGFDAVVLDCEHGPFGIESLPPLIAAAQAAGIASIVRVADRRDVGIGAALDAGADAVLVPHVSSPEDAEAVVAAGRFPPLGHRGANPWVRAARFGADDGFFSESNDRTALIAMVEGSDGVQALDRILEVDGLDAVFVGPVDLSSSLGIPGETEHPDVVQLVADVVVRSLRVGSATAVFAATPVAAARWIAAGARLVALGVDTGLILDGLRAARRGIAEALP